METSDYSLERGNTHCYAPSVTNFFQFVVFLFLNDWIGVRIQPVAATHWLNRSAGVSNSKVFLGRSLSCLATLLSFA